VGTDIFFSRDADETEVVRAGLNLDFHYRSADDLVGVRVERVSYQPNGGERVNESRVYLRAARRFGDWQTRATIGTDGDHLLGSASINDDAAFRKELFFERDKVETPLGVTRPILATFVGAAVDVPLARNSQVTLLGGLQSFTGRNRRTHLRANLVQVLDEELGLSAQLRTRYYRNSEPGEFDYFSPRQFVEAVPVLQLRRFRGGWQYLAAAGWGAQRNTGSGWRSSRYLNLRLSSPANRRGWIVRGDATYTNTPVGAGKTYGYFATSFGLARAF
jgi:hypothetical protein